MAALSPSARELQSLRAVEERLLAERDEVSREHLFARALRYMSLCLRRTGENTRVSQIDQDPSLTLRFG